MAERHQWTEEDLQALREAVATLERLGVWTVYVRGAGITQTTVHVSSRDLAGIARLPGTTVAQPQWRHGSWEVRAEAGGLSITARVATEELPAVGWPQAGTDGNGGMNGPWIPIEDGALLNLAQVVSIRVRRTERLQANEWEVVASLAGGGTTKLIKGTKDTCERWRDRLAEQLGVLA